MDLNGSVAAIVTGGASGLGEATVRELARAGVKIAIFDLNAAKGEALAQETGAVFCPCNVTDETSTEAAFAKARAAHGQERILVNCAGTGVAIKTAGRNRETGEIVGHPIAQFERIIAINLVGTFRCIAKAAAGMLALPPVNADGERGVLINTASIAAEDGQKGQAAYSASKNGVIGMTLPIARDLGQEGIRICTILPGLFETPLVAGMSEENRRKIGASIPFPKRAGRPEEYARLVRHICENAMLNGESIRLDGGARLQYA